MSNTSDSESEVVSVTEKRQVTIPKRLREKHGISAPGRVKFVELCWERAAAFTESYGIALGETFALATADAEDGRLLVGADDADDGRLLVGADDDFDGVDVPIERIRDEGV